MLYLIRLACLVGFIWGCVSPSSITDRSYALPFADSESYKVLQGYNGPYGHTGKVEFAYDFSMPIGTAVLAVRDGVVLKTEARYEDGNRTPGQENYIFISHGDGTFSRYYHLTKHGVSVVVGKRVRRGQLIGRSGDTGASAGPHLHFDVTQGCAEWGCQTIPIQFRNATENPLVAGRMYRPAL